MAAIDAELLERSTVPLHPVWIRLPAPGRRCPYTGLSRTSLAELCTACHANGGEPLVVSTVVKKRNAIRGIRLISFDSLMAYLASLTEQTMSKSL